MSYPISTPRRILLGSFLGLFAASAAHAQWTPSGVPVCTSPGTQDYPLATPDGSRGVFVAWRDFRSGQYSDLYLHHVTASGVLAPGWPPSGLPLAVAAYSQVNHSITADGTGGAIVVWQDSRDYFSTGDDIYALRVLGSGERAPGWPVNGLPVCRAPDDQRLPAVVADGAGGAVIAWGDFRNGSGYYFINPDVYAIRVTAEGTVAAGWAPDGVPVANSPASECYPGLVATGDGGAIVVYQWEGDIYAQRLTGDGNADPGWPPGGAVVSAANDGQALDAVCSDGAGGAFAAWTDHRNYPGFGVRLPWQDIYAQHVTAGGETAAGWAADGLPVCAEFYGQLGARLIPDGQGGFVAAWDDYRAYGGEIYAVRMRGSGAIAPGWPVGGRLVSNVEGAEYSPTIAEDGAGGAYLAFENQTDTGPWRIHAQHLTATGAIAAGWPQEGIPVADPPQDGFNPSIVNSGSGAIVVWEGGLGSDIYAQKLVTDGPVPALVSLVSVEARPEEVVLRWHAAAGLSTSITVGRKSAIEDWRSLGTVYADGSGHIKYRDRSVVPGTRYAYRLSYLAGGAEETTAEVWVEVPTALAIGLEGFRPNPTSGVPVVWFTLPTDSPATLDLFEVSGRRLLGHEVGGLGAGLHALRFSDGNLAPGVYWLRLRQGAQMLVRRAVVVN